MNILKKYNRKYRLLYGIIAALIVGVALGIMEKNRDSIVSMGGNPYRNTGRTIEGNVWIFMIFMFALLHFVYYKRNEEVYDIDIILPKRNVHFEELGVLGMVACIEINLTFWPYILCHYGNIFHDISVQGITVMVMGLCLSSMIIFSLIYVLTITIKNPVLMMGIGELWMLLFYKTSIYSWEAPSHYIQTMKLVNPLTQGYEYQRVLTYYYYLKENGYDLNTMANPLPNYFTLFLGGVGVLVGLSEIAYYLKRRNMYTYLIDEGAY